MDFQFQGNGSVIAYSPQFLENPLKINRTLTRRQVKIIPVRVPSPIIVKMNVLYPLGITLYEFITPVLFGKELPMTEVQGQVQQRPFFKR